MTTSIDDMIQERIALSSLQIRIPSSEITILPNRKQILFLAPNYNEKGKLSLQILNLENNEENKWYQALDFSSISGLNTELSLEQKLLRERMRMSSHGITTYLYHKETNKILFQYGPHLCISKLLLNNDDIIDKENSIPVIKIGDPKNDSIGTRMDANLTKDGLFVIFARNDDLWITPSNGIKKEIQLTFSKKIKNRDVTCGVADFINQEEFDRFTGYWLNDNFIDDIDKENKNRIYSILYLEADNTNVPIITIPSMDGVETHKWPRSGETNCKFKVKIIKISISIDSTSNQPIFDINNNNTKINDFQLKQSIYSSFKWIEYIVRCGWTKNINQCWIQYLDRDQMKSSLVLYEFDKHFIKSTNDSYNDTNDNDENKFDESLSGKQMFYLQGTPWINIIDGYKCINNGIIWTLEHSGFKHLYFIPYPKNNDNYNIDLLQQNATKVNEEKEDQDGTKVNMKLLISKNCEIQQLTSGKWQVENESIWFNDKTNTIYFRGRKETHLEKHLYSLQFNPLKKSDNIKITKLTESGYFHDTKVDSINFEYFTSIYSSISKAKRLAIYSLKDGKCIKSFDIPYRGNPNTLKYVEPQLIEIINFPKDATKEEKEDEDFKKLYTFQAVIYPPFDEEYQKTNKYRDGGYPTIIYVYGGPHVQLITNSWDRMTGNSRYQLWRSLGFTVAIIDNRGSNNRGLAFEGRIKYKMGCIEIDDQVKLCQYLINNGLTNPKQIAITGYSYGGYMSLMAMCQRPDIFKMCISGAPVTKWELYDTGYTERYMGIPQKYKNAYNKSSVLNYINQFPNQENRVIIIHGLSDENVHFYHTSKLIQAMIKANKPYNLKIFPGERHGIRQFDNIVYMEKFYIQQFQKMLQ